MKKHGIIAVDETASARETSSVSHAETTSNSAKNILNFHQTWCPVISEIEEERLTLEEIHEGYLLTDYFGTRFILRKETFLDPSGEFLRVKLLLDRDEENETYEINIAVLYRNGDFYQKIVSFDSLEKDFYNFHFIVDLKAENFDLSTFEKGKVSNET